MTKNTFANRSLLILGITVASAFASEDDALAQRLLCPTSIPGQPGVGIQTGFALENGACTNGNTGAFSGAALATQALSELSQSTTQESNRTTVNAISERRAQEEQRCPAGLTRVNGECQRIATPDTREQAAAPARPAPARPAGSPARPAPARETEAPARPAPARATEAPARPRQDARRPLPAPAVTARPAPAGAARPSRVSKSDPAPAPIVTYAPVVVETGPRFGAWAHAFGDYERRNATGTATILCCTNAPVGATPNILDLSIRSRTTTAGFVGGLDLTSRGIIAPGDGIIVGLLTGYLSSELKLRTSIISRNPSNVVNGSGNLEADLSGPSAGAFATYFNGGLSVDLTVKTDFLDVEERFNDRLGFSANLINGNFFPAKAFPFSGQGSTQLANTSIVGNANYRFSVTENYWIEPTVGLGYTSSNYASSAAALGLADGHVVRVQGGARFGTELFAGATTRVTAVLTGLAFSNVDIEGGFVSAAAFGTNNLLAQADEGKVRGQGILTLNLDHGNGVSTFLQGDVRGGEDYFGAGGRAGFRIQW